AHQRGRLSGHAKLADADSTHVWGICGRGYCVVPRAHVRAGGVAAAAGRAGTNAGGGNTN
nr:hypothetical protein [Tanacetum cinerariifolium]